MHTFLLLTLRSNSALLRSSPWPASSRSSSTRLSRSSCWNSRSSKSFVSVSRASASFNDSVTLCLGVEMLLKPLWARKARLQSHEFGGQGEGWARGNWGRNQSHRPTPSINLAEPFSRGIAVWSADGPPPNLAGPPFQATAPTLLSGKYCRGQVVLSHHSPIFGLGGGPRGPGEGAGGTDPSQLLL